ncbi:hypothetical protein DFJ74DRAFT_771889 [Hyaloraphidium curvatum]|nr:hypothetical protein DFJ74DRAFT_771889 [Hyaloraphidium curvatum]
MAGLGLASFSRGQRKWRHRENSLFAMPPKKSGVPRKSCGPCFVDKKRCLPGTASGAACQRCATTGRTCDFAGADVLPTPIAPPTDDMTLLDSSLDVDVGTILFSGLAEAVESFVAGGALPILHPTTLAAPGPTLLLAIAALGSSDLDDARTFAGAALTSVLAGLLDPLETAQSVVLLLHYAIFRTMSAAVPPLLVTGRAALAALCLDASGSFSQEMREPATVEQWIRAESALRCWCMFNELDSGVASYFGDAALFDAAVYPVPLPAHDSYFLSPDPQSSFDALVEAGAFGPGRFAIFSASAEMHALEACTAAVRQIVGAIFDRRASCLAACSVKAFVRSLRAKLRGFASDHGVCPLAIVGKERDECTPDEATYCDALDALYDLVGVLLDSMPEGVGVPLAAGEPLPLLSDPSFPDRTCARIVFIVVFNVLATCFEAAADPREGSSSLPSVDALFGSPAFLRILDRVQTMCDLLEHLDDADLPQLHPTVIVHMMRVGMFSVVLFRVVRDDPASGWAADRLRRNVEDIARALTAMGNGSAPAAAKVAADFARAARAAGALDEGYVSPEVTDAELGEVHVEFAKLGIAERESPVAALSEAMIQLDRGVSTWLPSLEDWTRRPISGQLIP